MTRINEETIKRKGIDYILSLEEFEIVGNHYHPYPKKLLHDIIDQYNVSTDYFGPSDQGCTVSTFKRKPSKQQLLDQLKIRIKNFEESERISIIEWKYKD